VEHGESHRVIIRFVDPTAKDTETAVLQRKVRELRARPGVVQAKDLAHVGMAVVACASREAEEELVRDLEDDPEVEFATPDTEVHFHREAPAFAGIQDLRQCSAQSSCAALGLVGNCCPATDGLMLACCDGPTTENLVAFQSFHGKYVVAEETGAVHANRAERSSWEQFQIYFNDDGTVSLRSHFGKYVTAEDSGDVSASSLLIGNAEKFKLISHEDKTVSLQSFSGQYFVAEQNGALHANRQQIGDWEKFTMTSVGGPSQRLPNDANFSALWGMHAADDNDIDAPEAWKKFTGEFSTGIVVAVIDTGIDHTHEDLRENMWVNPGEIPGNGIDDDGNGYIDDIHGADFANEDGDPMDDQMHGTHCAGTIAGVGNNGVGVAGVAWHGVRLMALKFLTATGGGRTSDAIKAVDYAVAHGAKIASNSWGGGGSSAALRTAIERAEAAGVLFVAAAGNSGSDNDRVPQYPANYPASSIVSVASTTSKGELSSFSCYGTETVDLAAPGSNIYSTVPNQRYKALSGTSMATPHVSGLAALVWMYRPALSMAQVKELLMTSVDRSQALEGKVLSGGRINARKAIDAASGLEPAYPPRRGPQALAFQDIDPKIGLIGGTVTITTASDESDVEYYKVYWVSRAGFQLDALGNVTATGARVLEVPLANSTVLPLYAAGLVAVAGNATGEMPAQLGGPAPNVTVDDFGVPELGPQSVEWEGDVDPKTGVVAGRLSLTRAEDEKSISQYNIYWSNATGPRGPRVGSIPSIGFVKPRCSGDACPMVNMTTIPDGYRFNRENYKDLEEAKIVASGPGVVRITRFDTEQYYDTLTVGTTQLSGSPRVPLEIELPAGLVSTIHWSSDESLAASGWTFELMQGGATVDFQLESVAPLGQGLEIVPAYGKTEMSRGVFVKVVDRNTTIPPSAGVPATGTMPSMESNTMVRQGLMHTSLSKATGPAGQKAKTTMHNGTLEPWLHQWSASKAQNVVWPTRSAAVLKATQSVQSRILGAITIPGLDAHSAVEPSLHVALKRALVDGLPQVQDEDVTVVRVLEAPGTTLTAEAGHVRTKAVSAATLEFEIRQPHGAKPSALDRIEARLILLSKAGPSAERFDRELVAKLAEVGRTLPAGTRTRVREPQQIIPKRHGRSLAAVASDPEREATTYWDDMYIRSVFDAIVTAGLAAAFVLGVVVCLIQKRRKHVAMDRPPIARLEWVAVHQDGGILAASASDHD